MTDQNVSDYFKANVSTHAQKRRYAQNSLIVDTAIAINKALEAFGVTQKDLAARLQKSEGVVSQVLSGGTNLTLRTLADFAYSLECSVEIILSTTGNIWPI
jgi:ribosome-binding protein aMBF1 (putative translation factor)